MSNQSLFHIHAQDVRAEGIKDPKTGVQFGGTYYPAHTTANGKQISARWKGNVYVNNRGWTDTDGTQHPGESSRICIIAWNNRNSFAGSGLADIMAKCVNVGKEFSCSLRLNTFDKRVFVNNTLQVDNTGKTVTQPAVNFVIKSDLKLGSDSSEALAREIMNYAETMNFISRPQFWNVPGTADEIAWKGIKEFRKAAFYTNEATYGYARVEIPEGATLAAPKHRSTNPQVQTQVQTAPVQQAAPAQGPPVQQTAVQQVAPVQIQAGQVVNMQQPNGTTIPMILQADGTYVQQAAPVQTPPPTVGTQQAVTGQAPTQAATTLVQGATAQAVGF